MRGLAIHRALVRAGARGRFLLATPALDLPGLDLAALELAAHAEPQAFVLEHRTIAVDATKVADRDAALASDAARALADFAPDVILVDLFWAPFLHVLRAQDAPAWLLLRSCPPRWLVGPPALPFDATAFARVIVIEPCAEGPDGAERIDPIVIAHRDETPPGPSLRARLGVDDPRPLALVAHGGRAGEIETLTQLAQARLGATHVIVHADLRTPGAPFPLAPFLGQADRIVGGVGYNLAWELAALGLLGRALLVPFARAIDDQAARARSLAAHRFGEDGATTLARELLAHDLLAATSSRARPGPV